MKLFWSNFHSKTFLGVCIQPSDSRRPSVDGGWSSWGPLSDCTATCGLGVQTRLRQCNNPSYGYYSSFTLRDNFHLRPQNGGATCDGDNIELSTCHMKECPIGTGDRRYTECKKYGQRTGKTLFPAAVPSRASNQCLLYCRESGQTPYDTNSFVPAGKNQSNKLCDKMTSFLKKIWIG